MQPRDILQHLRDGQPLSADQAFAFAKGLATDAVSDAQAGAFAMAVCHAPLDPPARVALTLGMRDSGRVMSWDLDGPVLDKHSTGGVGDAVSLLLAPMLACVGCFVPMISGRGLGHTGGTLDKLEAIPGVQTQLSTPKFRQIVAEVGCAIVAPTPDIAPADRRLYGVRDVTGTVRSPDLITSSILSKKLAAGLQGLVLDVKVGAGAVMSDMSSARDLAQALVTTASDAGCPTTALITSMDQPLLPSIGNAVEIADVMRAFESGAGDLVAVAVALGAELLVQAGVLATLDTAEQALRDTLQSGAAKARFGDMIHAQGGPRNFADRWQDYLSIAPMTAVPAPNAGYIAAIDGTQLGHLVVALGGGRQREADVIDAAVGLSDMCRLGQFVQKGAPLAHLHMAGGQEGAEMIKRVQAAITIGDGACAPSPLVLERIAP